MSLPLVPTTELEAVNAMLGSVGEAPVSQLDNVGLGDAASARQTLHNNSRRIQKRGWSWNTDFNMTLALAIDGTIPVPSNTLKVNPTGNYDKAGIIQRGVQLYDAVNHTYVFTAAVTVDLVSFLNFELLPETARQAIFLAAATSFQSGFLGSDTLDKFTTRDALTAWSDLLNDELAVTDCNFLTDSADMAQAMNRIGGYYG